MSVENLALWERLAVTDPKHTKSFNRAGGFKGTAIKPMWAIWRATKEFGPIGIGWGWTEHQHVVESGMIFTQVSVWYVDESGTKAWSGPQWGGTAISSARKDGTVHFDDESFKKSTTDGITKCLSYIGIGADVHMGQFDDTKYVEEAAKTTAANEKQDSNERTRLWIAGTKAAIGAAAAIETLREAYGSVLTRQKNGDLTEAQAKELFDLIAARKDKLSEGKAAAE